MILKVNVAVYEAEAAMQAAHGAGRLTCGTCWSLLDPFGWCESCRGYVLWAVAEHLAARRPKVPEPRCELPSYAIGSCG